MNCEIEIKPEHHRLVIQTLSKHLNLTEVSVYVFGSRSKGASRRCSDLDLAIETSGEKMLYSTLIKIKNDFEESCLPYTVDIVDLNDIDENFKNLIKKDFIKLIG